MSSRKENAFAPSVLALVFILSWLLALPTNTSAHAASPLQPGAPVWVWWEAETPRATNFPPQNPFAPTDENAAKALSGGKWIGATGPGKALFLEYEITVAKSAEYKFYARKFWFHGPFRWRFDDQPWRECGRDIALLDDVSLAKFVNANWVDVGVVKLEPGKHLLRIELAESTEAAAFDCFLLTDGSFAPRGKLKPGEKYGVAPAGWFPFEPDPDPFLPSGGLPSGGLPSGGLPSGLDLRYLNEKAAGDGGFIRVKGDGFVHQKGDRPIRFWAVNAEHELLAQAPAAMERFARRLAKLGVNMVRLHGPLWREKDVAKVDEDRLAKIHHLVAALKNEGIYLTLSSYFPLWLKPNGSPGFEGITGDMHPFAIPFFNTRFQDLQKTWWKTALTRKNPRTGLTLLQDPTLAFVEIVNEDGLFFWTFTPYEKVPAPQMELLEKRYGEWLKNRYGDIGKALAKWGTKPIKGDAPATGRAGFMPLYEMFEKRDARAQDTAEFLTGLQREYYDRMYTFLKKELGFKGAVTCSNWITAEPRLFGPLDKWSNTRCDFMDRHGYYGGPHEGERASYMLSKGDSYDDASALLFETGKTEGAGAKREQSFSLPIMDLAYNGKPSTNSEINWVPPNRFRADLPLLSAAYGALQGTDALYFFVTGDVEWPQRLEKFTVSDPVGMGQFPAAALIFRKGLVRTAEVALRVESRLSDLYALKGIPISAPQNLDELRKRDLPLGKALDVADVGSIDPLAFLVGRVEVNITEKGGTSRTMDLSRWIDRKKQTVRSATNELHWDYQRGLATVDAPAAQGATGFLSRGGPIALGDVTIQSGMEYGAVVLVALDDLPLATSRKMLLQVMSEDNNFGWSAPGKGLRKGLRTIADIGGPPIVVKRFEGKISLKRADAGSLAVTPLDFNGYRSKTSGKPSRGAQAVTLLPTTIHYLIEK